MTSSPHGPTPGATHVLQWEGQRGATLRGGANPETFSQFGLESATRLYEGGIASNRGSACRGEYVPGPCTHRPSHHESCVYPKSPGQLGDQRQAPKVCGAIGVKS